MSLGNDSFEMNVGQTHQKSTHGLPRGPCLEEDTGSVSPSTYGWRWGGYKIACGDLRILFGKSLCRMVMGHMSIEHLEIYLGEFVL